MWRSKFFLCGFYILCRNLPNAVWGELLVHSQTSTIAPKKIGGWYVISSHIIYRCNHYTMGIMLILVSKRAPGQRICHIWPYHDLRRGDTTTRVAMLHKTYFHTIACRRPTRSYTYTVYGKGVNKAATVTWNIHETIYHIICCNETATLSFNSVVF